MPLKTKMQPKKNTVTGTSFFKWALFKKLTFVFSRVMLNNIGNVPAPNIYIKATAYGAED